MTNTTGKAAWKLTKEALIEKLKNTNPKQSFSEALGTDKDQVKKAADVVKQILKDKPVYKTDILQITLAASDNLEEFIVMQNMLTTFEKRGSETHPLQDVMRLMEMFKDLEQKH